MIWIIKTCRIGVSHFFMSTFDQNGEQFTQIDGLSPNLRQFSSRSGESNHAQQLTNLLNLFPGRSPVHTTALLLLTFHMRKYFIPIHNKGSNIPSQRYIFFPCTCVNAMWTVILVLLIYMTNSIFYSSQLHLYHFVCA